MSRFSMLYISTVYNIRVRGTKLIFPNLEVHVMDFTYLRLASKTAVFHVVSKELATSAISERRRLDAGKLGSYARPLQGI